MYPRSPETLPYNTNAPQSGAMYFRSKNAEKSLKQKNMPKTFGHVLTSKCNLPHASSTEMSNDDNGNYYNILFQSAPALTETRYMKYNESVRASITPKY
jgi:hypothetical protein